MFNMPWKLIDGRGHRMEKVREFRLNDVRKSKGKNVFVFRCRCSEPGVHIKMETTQNTGCQPPQRTTAPDCQL